VNKSMQSIDRSNEFPLYYLIIICQYVINVLDIICSNSLTDLLNIKIKFCYYVSSMVQIIFALSPGKPAYWF
jgi:hypothetical protein